jgi:4-hydroxybenzoate polyprenyltransferase
MPGGSSRARQTHARFGVVRGLVAATHPGPTAVVTALSATLLVGLRAPGSVVAIASSAVLAGQLSVGWSNDWLDAARDRAVGRTDKAVVAGLVTAATVRMGALSAAAVCAVLSWSTGLLSGSAHLVAVASAWSYNAGLKRTAWSWLPYAASFGLLPVFLVLASGQARVPVWLVAAGALLGAGAHVANVLPDLEDDAATGVVGLPHRIGRRVSAVLAPALLATAVLVVLLVPGDAGWLGAVGAGLALALALGAGVIGATRPSSRAPFVLSMGVAAVCVVLLAAAGPRIVGG